MRCPRCGSETKNVMHFEIGKSYAFHECSKCHAKTHQKRIHFEEVKDENQCNPKRV